MPKRKNQSTQNSRKIWINVIVFIIVALVIGSGVYVWQEYNLQALQKQISSLQRQVVQLQEPAEEQIKTFDINDYVESNSFPEDWFWPKKWGKYQNDQYSFEVSFPKGWEIEQTENIGSEILAHFIIEDPNNPYEDYSKGHVTSITIYDNPEQLSLNDWIDKSGPYVTKGEGFYALSRTEKENRPAGQLQLGIEVLEGGPNHTEGMSFYIQKDNLVYRVRYFSGIDISYHGILAQYRQINAGIVQSFGFLDY